jgi:hypothetical protein
MGHTAKKFSPGPRKTAHLGPLMLAALILHLPSGVATFAAAKKNVQTYLATTATVECYARLDAF